MHAPGDLRYTADHEWLYLDGDLATVGITPFAAEALGDVVFVDLPDVGTTVSASECCGEIESTKTVTELYAPADGEVTEINDTVVGEPSLLNNDPLSQGWLFRMKVTGTVNLLDAAAYQALIGGE